MWRILPEPTGHLGAADMMTTICIQHRVAAGLQFRSSGDLGMGEGEPLGDDAIEFRRMALECRNVGDVILIIEERQALGLKCLLWDLPASRRADLELGPPT